MFRPPLYVQESHYGICRLLLFGLRQSSRDRGVNNSWGFSVGSAKFIYQTNRKTIHTHLLEYQNGIEVPTWFSRFYPLSITSKSVNNFEFVAKHSHFADIFMANTHRKRAGCFVQFTHADLFIVMFLCFAWVACHLNWLTRCFFVLFFCLLRSATRRTALKCLRDTGKESKSKDKDKRVSIRRRIYKAKKRTTWNEWEIYWTERYAKTICKLLSCLFCLNRWIWHNRLLFTN